MNIAEMFVRVQADVSDVNRKMRDIERALGGVDRSAKTAQLSTGRLGSQFANLASQIGHVHPIVGNLAGVLGNFAIGAGLTVGVLAGVAAVAVVFDKLTSASRKAMEAGDKLAETYNQLARIDSLGGAFGGKQKADIEDINKGLEQHNKWLGFIIAARIQLGSLGGLLGKDPGGHEAKSKAGTTALGQAGKERDEAIVAARERAAAKAEAAANKLAAATKKAAEFAEKYAMFMYEASKWTANISGATLAGLTLQDAESRLGLDKGKFSVPTPDFSMPNIAMPLEGLDKKQKEQLQEMGILIDDTNKNSSDLQNAIWGSAQQLGSVLVNALNVGGGGQGSQIGGMIGSGLGMIAGSMLGPGGAVVGKIGGVLGGVIGGLAGSLFGGLFDSNKKEVNANTQALRANTQALLLYAPAGFKSEPYRYASSDPRPLDSLGRTIRHNASRGGANPLLGT